MIRFKTCCRSAALVLYLLLNNIPLFSQSDLSLITDSIMMEGKSLFRSEMASWYGTDIFLEKYKDRQNLKGYLSYDIKDKTTCIFFSRAPEPKVIGTITFDSSFNVSSAMVDLNEREFTETELQLYTIRTNALNIISTDTFFKKYTNTDLNLVPLISQGEKKVYILTGPKNNGIIIFGNDYLLTFNGNNELVSKSALHKNIMPIDYKEQVKNAEKIVGGIHTHLPGSSDFITATDICTLLLYGRFTSWETYTVVSENYYSFWNCKDHNLAIISKVAMQKINEIKKDKN